MNDRIKELMAQAGFDPAAIERMGIMPQAEKFAELIVQECARVGGDIVLYQNEDNDMGVFLGIKQSFGVE